MFPVAQNAVAQNNIQYHTDCYIIDYIIDLQINTSVRCTVAQNFWLVRVWQEKQTMEKRLDDSDVYIVSLQEKIKALVTEKETLLQAKKALEEDKEQYQVMMWCKFRNPRKMYIFVYVWP